MFPIVFDIKFCTGLEEKSATQISAMYNRKQLMQQIILIIKHVKKNMLGKTASQPPTPNFQWPDPRDNT